MKRHGDRKAYLRDKGKNSLQWSGRVGDRDANASQQREVLVGSQQQDSLGTPLSDPLTPSASASPPNTARSLVGGGSAEQDGGGKGRLVPVGEHHEGSFGVYMAHKMDKLRHQVDGAVARLEGPQGNVFKGVVAHINGHTAVPVATLRELLASRGGVVEAYNTPRCTHMICEALPYAKIRELRKLRHPPRVVRSAWVEDSARAGRKLALAEYMVDGVLVQKRTLAASFVAAASPKPSPNAEKSVDGCFRGSSSRGHGSGSDGVPPVGGSGQQHRPSISSADAVGQASFTGGASGAASLRGGRASGGHGLRTGLTGSSCLDATGPGEPSVASGHVRRGVDASIAAPPITQPATPARTPKSTSPLNRFGPGSGIKGGMDSGSAPKGEARHSQVSTAGGERSRLKPGGADAGSPYFEISGMGAAGEGGRSTKDDPTFMDTFFKKSRLHFIGVGRAHAVKVVNAGLAARTKPDGVQPVFAGPLGRGDTRVILHVDMDCFFVSVLVKNRPELKDKPVAVAHNASNAKGAGSSEVSSCNYPARAKGLKAGMFMMKAKELCPELVVLRYDFEAYSEASDKMYGVFLRHAPVVMAVSCDEAFLELAKGTDPMGAATEIRRSIFKETGCPASAGASSNMLLARMATKEAKPNGQFWLPPDVAMHHMGPLPVQDLPGVGWKLRRRLNNEGLSACSDLWPLSAAHLQKGLGLGEKTGQALWEACRGIDKRPVQAPPDRKSIGAEVNYGVRFDTQAQADGFLSKLAVELSSRMHTEGVVGRALTLKVMKQRDGVGLPRKYLGHGVCDARSKLLNLRRSTADAETLISHALQLLKECKVPPDKIRGIGVQMTRLDSTVDTGGGRGSKNGGALNAWLMRAGEEEDSDPLSSLEQNHSSADVGENETALLQDSAPNALRGSQPHSPDRGAASQTMRPAKPKDRLSHEAGNKRAREVDGEMPGVILRPSIRHRGDCSERAALIVGSAAEDGAVMTQVSRGTNGESRDSEKEEEEEEVAKVANTRVAMEVSAGMSAVVGPVGLATLAPPAKQSHVQALRSDGGIDNIVAGGVASPCTVPRRVPTGSPEPVHPSVRVRRVEGTPPGVACSPSMSQLTFSQIDNTVLGALPPDLRQEVTAQLEARQRQRHENATTSSPPTANRAGASGEEKERVAHWSAGSKVEGASAAAYRAEATGGMASAEVVREGFDLTVREGSVKPHQVSLDSLWTLHKMREGDDEPGGASAVFDRESLRAMPLGLGLQYASLTENQRAQIARRYAHHQPGEGAAIDRTNAAPVNRAAVAAPPSPAVLADAHDRDGGHRCSPSRRLAHPSPRSSDGGAFLSPASGCEVTPAGEPACAEQLDRVSLSQVDRDVLDCLPSDVREEVLRAIASNGGGGGDGGVVDANCDVDADHRDGGAASGTAADAEALADDGRAPEFVDLLSPSPPTPPSERGDAEPSEAGERWKGGAVFEVERAETLRGAMREWIGGAVRTPSQWHLELLYRYLEELVEDGRLDDTATFLRCLGRLSSKADQDALDTDSSRVDGGGGWRTGYNAVLADVQELVKRRTGGASLALLY